MADEVKDDKEIPPEGKGAVPAFDPEKMRTLIREELQQHLTTEAKDQNEIKLDPTPTVAQPTVNPLQAVIDPLIAPHIARANLAAEGARDAVTFYMTHPEAVKHQAELEKAFNTMIAQGNPFTHEAIWAWYRGQNFDKFLKEAQDVNTAQVDLAKQNADGSGGLRPGGGPVKDAHSATDDELAQGLAGVTF